MKKVFSLIVLLAAVTMFTACSSDDATYTPTPKLEIANADLMFEAEGGTGSVTVNGTGALTAETTSQWVSLSFSGNTVNVTVDENVELSGRSATITLKADGAEAQVSVTQKGSVYGLGGETSYSLDDAKKTLRIGVVHTSAVTVKSLADWITASFDEEKDQIVIVASANDSGWRRTGQVAFQTGIVQDTITISQFDFDTDVLGEFYFVYATSSAGSTWNAYPATLTRTGLAIEIDDDVLTIPVTVDEDALSLSAGPNGADLGTYMDYTTRLLYLFRYGNALYNSGYTYSYSTGVYSTGVFDLYEGEDGSTSVVLEFDASVYSDNDLYAWRFTAFEDDQFVSASVVGNVGTFYYPSLKRPLTEAAAESPRKAAARSFTPRMRNVSKASANLSFSDAVVK